MKSRIFFVFIITFLAACAPAATPSFTSLPPTEMPTFTLIPPPTLTLTPIPEFTPLVATPTPPPPTVPAGMTPDAIQVERWTEYQTALAKALLPENSSERVLCEWDILGRSGQEVYVWAVCGTYGSGGRKPAVIYLNTDGSIQKVRVAWYSASGESYVLDLFPVEVQAKILSYFSSPFLGRAYELGKHLEYRLTHPDEPPLIVLSATPMP